MMLWQGCISISLQELSKNWKLSNIELGAIGSCHTFGIMTGSYLWGYSGNVKGALWSLKQVFLLNVFFGVFYVCSVNVYMVAIAAFLVGFCGGGALVLTGTLFSEILEEGEKWTFMMLTAFISVGGLFAYSCALIVVAAGNGIFFIFRWVGIFNVFCMAGNRYSLRFLLESSLFLIENPRNEKKSVEK
jgi:MFS family permease